MLSSRTATRATLHGKSSLRSFSILSSTNNLNAAQQQQQFKPSKVVSGSTQLQQQRTLLGLVHAIDKRVYRWAKGVLPPISKTENIALGCGTIGTSLICVAPFDLKQKIATNLTLLFSAIQ